MSETRVDLQEKIRQGRVTVAIIGLGYVGLPLAVGFARAGVRVRGIDVSLDRVARINAGVSYIPDVPTEVLAPLVAAGTLRAGTAFQQCAEADATVICVPTPFNRMKAPDLSYIEAATQSLAPHVAPGALVVLQSTTYPGTTEELVRPSWRPPDDRWGKIICSRSPPSGSIRATSIFLRTTPPRL